MVVLVKVYDCVFTNKGKWIGIQSCDEQWLLDWNDPYGRRIW